MNVAVIGVGYWGTNLARVFSNFPVQIYILFVILEKSA
jgi:glycerol-3-phosphate dehydrogenase